MTVHKKMSKRLILFPKCGLPSFTFKTNGDIKHLNSFVDFQLTGIWTNYLIFPSIVKVKNSRPHFANPEIVVFDVNTAKFIFTK